MRPKTDLSPIQTDLITREDAEHVLSKGPMAPSLLHTTIHRLPSLATIGGSFWAGSSLTTELIATTAMTGVIGSGIAVAAPVAVGCLTVAGTMMLFSRSSRKSRVVDAPARGFEMVRWEGGVAARRRVDVDLIVVLKTEDVEGTSQFASSARSNAHLRPHTANPMFKRPEGGIESQLKRVLRLK